MARLTKAKGKVVRRLGINVFGNAKYDRLLKRKPYIAGEPRRGRTRQSEYAKQLLEKQKIKFAYGVSERQMVRTFKHAKSMAGVTGYNMLLLLERRIDNVVYRLGMAASHSQARQLVSHGHILLNNRKITVPSVVVRESDTIGVRPRKVTHDLVRRQILENSGHVMPPWLSMSKDNLQARVEGLPNRDAIPTVAEEQLVVEYYSR